MQYIIEQEHINEAYVLMFMQVPDSAPQQILGHTLSTSLIFSCL